MTAENSLLIKCQTPGIKHFAQRLREWNNKINLISPTTVPELELRHIADSAQLIDDLPTEPCIVADVGTGGGFPGLVLAILCPQHAFTLIESDSRKAAFLMTIIQELNLKNVQVKNQRVEDVQLSSLADYVTARAFAPLERLLPQTRHLLSKNGQWLLLKGEAVDVELRVCETLFPMTTSVKPSKILLKENGNEKPAGVVVHIKPRPSEYRESLPFSAHKVLWPIGLSRFIPHPIFIRQSVLDMFLSVARGTPKK